jgi:integrase/recombinase XerD
MSTSIRVSECAPERPRLGDPLLDRYLEFVESRARHNTLLATASDLRAFFAVVAKPAPEVSTADVLEFIAEQRRPRGDGRVVRLADGESGLSSRTIKRRLSSVSGLYVYLTMCDEAGANPVPRGLARAGRAVVAWR